MLRQMLLYQHRCYYIVMPRRKFSTTIYLTVHQRDTLRSRSNRSGVPVAELVRRAIDRDLGPATIDPLSVVAHACPDFLDSLTPIEQVIFAQMVGVTP